MTTKLDLFRDCLTDLIINFRFDINDSDGGEDGGRGEMSEFMREEIVRDMMGMIEDIVYDDNATKEDFAIRVICKKANTPYGDIVPDIAMKSEVL